MYSVITMLPEEAIKKGETRPDIALIFSSIIAMAKSHAHSLTLSYRWGTGWVPRVREGPTSRQ